MKILEIIQILLSIVLVILVLIQSKGKGLSSMVSGSIGYYRSRRGFEKVLFIMTILIAILFAVNSVLLMVY